VLHREQRGPVTVVTIDRQQRRNAVDHATLDELAGAIGDAAGARALVLTGAGGHFCAGADLTGVEDAAFASVLRSVLDALGTVPFPTIAAVEGVALGAGTQLAAACDLRVATPDARFGIPAARLGLMVDQWTVDRVARLAGEGTARAMLLAAEVVSGADAHRVGFVQRLGGLDAALGWAEEIAALAPLTIAGHKLALRRRAPPPPDAPDVSEALRRAWGSEDLREGMAAFRERRPPRFEGH
jgi:enoyl-CoA hydratase